MAQSAGRLSPFWPLSDDHGIDLVLLDKVSGLSLAIQVKSWFLNPQSPAGRLQFDIQKTTFSGKTAGVLLCVAINPQQLTIHASWVIPLSHVPAIATHREAKYALTPSPLANSKDRYTPYRHLTLDDLGAAILGLILGGQKAT